MDQLKAMSTFVYIVDQGSLTLAAEAMDTSLPSVVRTLAALEKNLGSRLLNRTTRRIALTEEGRYYLACCRRILADIDEAALGLTDHQQEPIGKLVVTAPSYFGQLHIAPLVCDYLNYYKKINIELILHDRAVNLIEEGIDVAIRIGHLDDSSLIARSIGGIRQVVCASPELIQSVGVPTNPDDLMKYPCIRTTGMTTGNTWHFKSKQQTRDTISVKVNEKFVCNHAAATVTACINGLGFGLLMSYQIQTLVDEGKLQVVLSDYEPEELPISVIYPHARLLSTRVRSFIDWTVAKLNFN